MPDILSEVKQYLKITWDSDDAMLSGIIERGKARLLEISGAPIDFDAEDLPKSLLLDYCRYANSQALEVFEKNFHAELLALYFRGRVMDANQETDGV